MEISGFREIIKKLDNKNDLGPEFANFEYKVDEISKIVQGLASKDKDGQQKAMQKADLYLYEKDIPDVDEDKLKMRANKSSFNPLIIEEDEANRKGQMSQTMFMRVTEKDAKRRAQDRKERYEEANFNKRRANKLFNEKKFEEALLLYDKAVEKVRDNSILWINRALTLMELGLYERALEDCTWALRANHNSFRTRLIKAKLYWLMEKKNLSEETLQKTRKKFPERIDEIEEYCKTWANK